MKCLGSLQQQEEYWEWSIASDVIGYNLYCLLCVIIIQYIVLTIAIIRGAVNNTVGQLMYSNSTNKMATEELESEAVIDYTAEAKLQFSEVSYAVKSWSLSKDLECSSSTCHVNVTTLELVGYTIKLDGSGFHVCLSSTACVYREPVHYLPFVRLCRSLVKVMTTPTLTLERV